jgi:hypothetical protein
MKAFMKILHKKYPPCPIRNHSIEYDGELDILVLRVWTGIRPKEFVLTSEDLSDIPKLLDVLDEFLKK